VISFSQEERFRARKGDTLRLDALNLDGPLAPTRRIQSGLFIAEGCTPIIERSSSGVDEPCSTDGLHSSREDSSEAATSTTESGEKSAPPRIFLHDLALTVGAEATTVASSLVITSLLSRWQGARALSEYLLLRRVLSWTISGTLLGLATGLPRYIAHAVGLGQRDEHAYFVAASICMVPTAVVIGGLMALFHTSIAHWFFGDSQEVALVIALALILVGFSLHRLVYGYYRGLLEMARANLLEICNVALLPLAVVLLLYRSQSVAFMMGITGSLMAATSIAFAIPILMRLRPMPPGKLRASCSDLLRYSTPRVPGEFGAAALTALGPMLAAHYMKIADISPLLLGLNILMVIGYAAGPLGVVLLSRLSMMLGQNRHDEVHARMQLLIAAVMEVSIFTCIQLAVFADVVVRAWVGPGFLNQIGVIRLVLLAIPPYLFFVTLRSTVDAVSVKPYNTRNVLASLTAYLVFIAAWIYLAPEKSLLVGIAIAILASQILLALLTVSTFRRFYGVSVPWLRLVPSLLTAIALGAAAFAWHVLRKDSISLAEAIVFEAVIAAAYLAALAWCRSGWVTYAWQAVAYRKVS
jgi:O-antigen/teichoic acid export membrane protein